MSTEAPEGLDLVYVRMVGEDVRARLFPRPSKVRDEATGERVDGPTPYPLPTALRYRPMDAVDVEVLFVSERSIQRVDEIAPDTPPTLVRVIYDDVSFLVDLKFGTEPTVSEMDLEADNDAATALLRAVTGMI